jgi:hypothetical protein
VARTTISLSDDLKAEMDALGESINWSATAAEAFRAEIERANVRSNRIKGKKMTLAIDRLKASKKQFEDLARDRGHAEGVAWAQESADFAELKSLSKVWPLTESCETEDALGAPGVFLRMISEGRLGDRQDINDFWTNLGHEGGDQDQYSHQFWDGFTEGALEVFEQVES